MNILIDSHAHLDMLKDPTEAMTRAHQAGVAQVVTIGIDLASSQKAAALAAALPGVYFTVGLHPHDAAQAQVPGSHDGSGAAVVRADSPGARSEFAYDAAQPDEAYWLRMEDLARSGAVAIGECGLDFFRDRSPRPAQRLAFARQIELAKKLDLPLVIHDRDAHDEVAAMLREHGASDVGGVLHCFSGDLALAKEVMDLGFMLGITGTITYKNNDFLRALAREVPLSRLVIETDCPFLAPMPHRGKRDNEPAYVALTCAALAQALGKDLEQVAAATTANARRLFRLPEAPGV